MTAARKAHPGAKLMREAPGHIAIYDYLDAVLPAGYAVNHSPNGGERHPAEAAQFKRMGTKPGWPDLEIVAPGGAVFFIEVKRLVGGVLSDDQKAVKSHFIEHDIPWALCRTIDDARIALAHWGIITREVVR